MDILGASCATLNQLEREEEEDLKEIVASSASISKYEKSNLKSLLPQIIAAIISASFHLGNGVSLAYSAILISQLQAADSDIKATTSENAWIASVLIVIAPPASIIGGILIDYFGRLSTIKFAGVPGALGWCLIAVSKNIPCIIAGRLLIGISSAWGTSPAMVYITEIAHTDIRGPLMSIGPIYVSLGMVLTYLGGWLINWRLLAWLCNIFIVVPCALCFFIPESPAWLILKGRDAEAKKSLIWLNKAQPQPENRAETIADMKFKQLREEQLRKNKEQALKGQKGLRVVLREFLKPTAYKPLIIFIGLFCFQHFSGIYITMFYSISFIEAAGTSINAFLASILIGVVRLVMSIVVTYLLKRYKRRNLIFLSAFGMGCCMLTSGLYTKWIQQGTTGATWMPVAAILLYVVFSTIGLLPIPLMLIAELYPLEIRGMAYSLTYSVNCIIMFSALQSYYTMNDYFGGAVGLQWFFAVTCAGGLVYSYIFLPETKGKKLSDIGKYFEKRFMYIGHTDTKEEELEEEERLNRK